MQPSKYILVVTSINKCMLLAYIDAIQQGVYLCLYIYYKWYCQGPSNKQWAVVSSTNIKAYNGRNSTCCIVYPCNRLMGGWCRTATPAKIQLWTRGVPVLLPVPHKTSRPPASSCKPDSTSQNNANNAMVGNRQHPK